VNISAVEEIQPLPTGEYRLRVKGDKEYLVTRTYRDNLRDPAHVGRLRAPSRLTGLTLVNCKEPMVLEPLGWGTHSGAPIRK
jgi:hypothetical protein